MVNKLNFFVWLVNLVFMENMVLHKVVNHIFKDVLKILIVINYHSILLRIHG